MYTLTEGCAANLDKFIWNARSGALIAQNSERRSEPRLTWLECLNRGNPLAVKDVARHLNDSQPDADTGRTRERGGLASLIETGSQTGRWVCVFV